MADAVSVIPASVLRNLSDKLYEKRKAAANELKAAVKQVAVADDVDHDKIMALINLLTNEFIKSPQANQRKGGLIGLAAVTVGLTMKATHHLEHIVPPVLSCFFDQDSRVRYDACEALYNIAKVVRGDLIIFFNQIFDALCKLSADSNANVQSAAHLLDGLIKDVVTESDQFGIEEFVPLLRERMNVLNPYVRQFLVGWINVLDGIPEIDMLSFLPDFLDGLFNMLSDSCHETKQQAESALMEFLLEIKDSSAVDYGRMIEILVKRAGSSDEFTRSIAITWVKINEFVKLGGDQLVPYYADIMGVILSCLSDKEDKIRLLAQETNKELQNLKDIPFGVFDVKAVLSTARRKLYTDHKATRMEALLWISKLLNKYHFEVMSILTDVFDALLKALSDPFDEVVLLVLEIYAYTAKDRQHFHQLIVFLIHNFKADNFLLEKRGAMIVRRLCVLLDAEMVFREMSTLLEKETDLDFAATMVQALNLILLTSSELFELRDILKQSLVNAAGKDLFVTLYSSWCHSPTAIISLCFLSQMYQLASIVIQSLMEKDINAKFLVQLDKLICLLESPIFVYLRLQLLEPSRYIWLLKALNGLLMLLPQQSPAFRILRTRLKTVPSENFLQILHLKPRGPNITEDEDGNSLNGINLAFRLQQFRSLQHQHHLLCRVAAPIMNHISSEVSSKILCAS